MSDNKKNMNIIKPESDMKAVEKNTNLEVQKTWDDFMFDTDKYALSLADAYLECSLPVKNSELIKKSGVPERTFYRHYNKNTKFWSWLIKRLKLTKLSRRTIDVLEATAKHAVLSVKHGYKHAQLFLETMDQDYRQHQIALKEAGKTDMSQYNFQALGVMTDAQIQKEINRLEAKNDA